MALGPDDVANVAFSKPPIGQRGYDQAEVDDFLDRIEVALRHPDQHTLTAEQVSTMVFRTAAHGDRGYHEGEVDDFLDRAAEALGGPPAPAPSAPLSTDTGERPRTGFFSSLFRRPPEI